MIPAGELDYEREARLAYEAWQRVAALCFLAVVRETMRARRPWCQSGGQLRCDCLPCVRSESYATFHADQLPLLEPPRAGWWEICAPEPKREPVEDFKFTEVRPGVFACSCCGGARLWERREGATGMFELAQEAPCRT